MRLPNKNSPWHQAPEFPFSVLCLNSQWKWRQTLSLWCLQQWAPPCPYECSSFDWVYHIVWIQVEVQLSLEGSRNGREFGEGWGVGKVKLKNEGYSFSGADEPHFPNRSIAFAVDLFWVELSRRTCPTALRHGGNSDRKWLTLIGRSDYILNYTCFFQHCEVSVIFSFYLEAIAYGIFMLFGLYCLLQASLYKLCLGSPSPGHCFKVSQLPMLSEALSQTMMWNCTLKVHIPKLAWPVMTSCGNSKVH